METTNIDIAERVQQAIEAIQQRKREACRVPDHALIIHDGIYQTVSDLLTPEGFRNVLQRLTDEGKIVTGETLNDTYVRIVEQEK